MKHLKKNIGKICTRVYGPYDLRKLKKKTQTNGKPEIDGNATDA